MSYYHHLQGFKPGHTFWRTVALIFVGMSLSLLAGMWSMSNRVEPAALVYQVCNDSRMVASIHEDGCAALQDQLHMEFLCTEANDRPDNHCWVEQK